MGLPIFSLVANVYMEQFYEIMIALPTAPCPPSVWLRYVDDKFVLIHEYYVDDFTNHINTINVDIKFTIESE